MCTPDRVCAPEMSINTHGKRSLPRTADLGSWFCFFVFESSVGSSLHGALPLAAPTHPSLSTFVPISPSFHSLLFSPTGRGLGRTAASLCLPNPLPSQVFFFPPLAPYSRQIKCTQLLPAETGLNCTPVAMAIPDDLRGWNVALQISVLGAPGSTDFLAWEVTHRA